MNQKSRSKLKTSSFDRMVAFSKIAAAPAAKLAAAKMVNQLRRDSIDEKALMEREVAQRLDQFVSELSRLKGGMMKFGQLISTLDPESLPLDLRNVLDPIVEKSRILADDSMYLDGNSIEKVLRRRLPKDLLDDLEVEEEPMKAASIGQVHRAVIKKTGETICLKIQYPEIKKAIAFDMKILKNTLGTLARIHPAVDAKAMDALLFEWHQLIIKELDYQRELRIQNKLYSFYERDPLVMVPKVYPQYSTPSILAMEYIPSLSFDDPSIKVLSHEKRADLGRLCMKTFLFDPLATGYSQSDAHMGNYGVVVKHDEPVLVLYDFGAYIHLDKGLKESLKRLFNALQTKPLNPRDLMDAFSVSPYLSHEMDQLIYDTVSQAVSEVEREQRIDFYPGFDKDITRSHIERIENLKRDRKLSFKGIPRQLTLFSRGLQGFKQIFVTLRFSIPLIELQESLAKRPVQQEGSV